MSQEEKESIWSMEEGAGYSQKLQGFCESVQEED